MGLGKEIEPAKRGQIIGLRQAGMTLEKIASISGVKRSTVAYTIKQAQERGPKQGSLVRSGRPRASTELEDQRMLTYLKRHPWATKAEIAKVYPLGLRTLIVRLSGMPSHLYHKRAARQQAISDAAKRTRLAFVALENARLAQCLFQDAWFTDECMIKPGQTTTRPWVWSPYGRSSEERYTQHMPLRSAGLMIWGAIHASGKVVLLFPQDYQEGGKQSVNAAVYQAMLEDFLPEHYQPGQVFIQDNAPAHKAPATMSYLQQLGVFYLDWPPYSPDLNVIENFWRALKLETHKRFPDLVSLGGGPEAKALRLKEAVQATVAAMTADPAWDLPKRLADSWPNRLKAVKKAKGARTKY